MLNLQKILAIETSTSACSVALKVDGVIHQLCEEGNNLHSKRLLAMVNELLQQHGLSLQQVELLVVGIGPGAFTGLRIGVGVAQGLAYSSDIPVLGVSSLQALAQSEVTKCNQYLVAGLDARMSEIYWTVFRQKKNGLVVEVFENHCLSAPQAVSLSDEVVVQSSTVFVGNAWSIYEESFSAETRDIIGQAKVVQSLPQAASLIEYACSQEERLELKSCFELSPLYIRNDIAKKKRTNPLISN